MKTIITTGMAFADIDALACGIAYQELLEKLGKDSTFVIPGPLNNTVTKSILKWDLTYNKTYSDTNNKFVIVDCSNPEVLSKEVNNITEVWDHRYGYQNNWDSQKIKVVIEEVGSCATLIWEEFKKTQQESSISKISANLLYTAIFSNTLNFNASVTTNRYIKAFEEIKMHTDLPENWIEIYYQESEEQIIKDPKKAIINDSKIVNIPNKNINITIGQIELWNSHDFINNNKETIKNTLLDFGNKMWFMTAPSISESKNYIYTEDQETKDNLTRLIDVDFEGDLGVTKKLWLRKEILKKMLQ